MRLNKIIAVILVVFGGFTLNAQPSPKKSTSQFSISFNDCKKNELSFISNDSIHFFSENKKYTLDFELINQNSENTTTISVVSNKYDLSSNVYQFEHKDQAFLLKHNYYISYNNKPILASVFKINFRKGDKKMSVLIDFTELKEEININKVHIPFKKGMFTITDPDNPKLIKITG